MRRLLQWAIPLTAFALILGAPPPDEGLLAYSLTHLTIVQVATYLFALEVGSLTDEPWFSGSARPWLASVASLVAAVVGFSALLTLATSATARYDVSLQFLQLLSSLDIAWVVATLYLAVRHISREVVSIAAGAGLLVACVVSIAMYLVVVGFTPQGGWLVDGEQLLRIVLPSDTFAAILSLSFLLVASRSADQPTAQERLQS